MELGVSAIAGMNSDSALSVIAGVAQSASTAESMAVPLAVVTSCTCHADVSAGVAGTDWTSTPLTDTEATTSMGDDGTCSVVVVVDTVPVVAVLAAVQLESEH